MLLQAFTDMTWLYPDTPVSEPTASFAADAARGGTVGIQLLTDVQFDAGCGRFIVFLCLFLRIFLSLGQEHADHYPQCNDQDTQQNQKFFVIHGCSLPPFSLFYIPAKQDTVLPGPE